MSSFMCLLIVFILLSVILNIVQCCLSRHAQNVRANEYHLLESRYELTRKMLDGTPHPLYIRDRMGRMVACNSSYQNMIGLSEGELIGTSALDEPFADRNEAENYHKYCLALMGKGEPHLHDRDLTMTDGRTLKIYHWALPYRGSDGEVAGMVAGWIDVSGRQQLLHELSEAKNAADAANRAKTTFLAAMSHEIRTPLNAVIGMLELAMKKAEQGVTDRFAIEVASGTAKDLLGLIGDILDISRIESGKLLLAPERANLLKIVESVARVFEGVAKQKHLSLVLELGACSDCDVWVDPLRFKQVLSNLLSNAIKFTEEGSVWVKMRAEPASDGKSIQMTLRVEDSGIGISRQDQQILFNPFAQVGNNPQSSYSGSGLGLMISRSLCEMMGGTLTLSSAFGEGTQVVVALHLPVLQPLVEQAVVEQLLPVDIRERSLRVLVVDDYPANRLLLCQQLSYLGHQVEDAVDGAHGLRAWRNRHFDVVITDCHMPIMNGYNLAQAIREEEYARGLEPCLILGLTANAQPEEKLHCLAAGMDECLFKPIGLKALEAWLSAAPEVMTPARVELEARHDGIEEIDLTNLEQLTRGDKEAMRKLLQELDNNNEEDMTRLQKLFAQHDVQGLSNLAHRIKGGARIIGYSALIQSCEEVETACGEQEHSALTEAINSLYQCMERLSFYLRTQYHHQRWA
ncbi:MULTISPECIES: ATP-binding protein [Pseudomonas]|uniref:ATP-binding protein n=1 Tax=Pseudomonas TaxID=286 RepID=UPI0009C1295A|nr:MULTISPECIES: ATP-binding protein [Pseudomonas]MBP5075162.1 response regulator [Pseudomonas chlororaphis]PWY37789.1 PAS domain S-box protein [Pseudomonas sp. RW409]QIT23392.1 response regulator [Pseudomonas chlororaphis subsp. aurantiaca]WDH01483.1 ATP-binding protein [Pseudomonas chlororaphis]WDH09670.1 ATP-binding protein [Pseudomonas chlororaphis]